MNLLRKLLITESRKGDVKKKYGNFTKWDLEFIQGLDPSNNSKYLMFLARELDKVRGEFTDEYMFNDWGGVVKKLLGHFHRYPEKYTERDIFNYESVEALSKSYKESLENVSKRELKKTGGQKIYQDGDYLVVIPTTKEASCLYGSGTKWCTTQDSGSYYRAYSRRGVLFYMLSKVLPESDPLHKIALYKKYLDGSEELYDALDKRISPIVANTPDEIKRVIYSSYEIMRSAWLESRAKGNYKTVEMEAVALAIGLDEEESLSLEESEYNHFGLVLIDFGGQEYAVGLRNEVEQAVEQNIRSLIEDIGLSVLNVDIDDYIDGDLVVDEFVNVVTDWVIEFPEGYLGDVMDGFDSNIYDKSLDAQTRLGEDEEKVKDLYDKDSNSWSRDLPEIERLEGEASELEVTIEGLTTALEGSRYYDEEQIDEGVENILDDIRESPGVWLEEQGYVDRDIEAWVDVEGLIRGVLADSSSGGTLASYDGEELTVEINNVWYYVYRTD